MKITAIKDQHTWAFTSQGEFQQDMKEYASAVRQFDERFGSRGISFYEAEATWPTILVDVGAGENSPGFAAILDCRVRENNGLEVQIYDEGASARYLLQDHSVRVYQACEGKWTFRGVYPPSDSDTIH